MAGGRRSRLERHRTDSLNLAARGSYQLKEQGKRRFYANEVPILCEILNLTFDEIYTDDSTEQEKNYL